MAAASEWASPSFIVPKKIKIKLYAFLVILKRLTYGLLGNHSDTKNQHSIAKDGRFHFCLSP